jgi:hypothetical protein
MERRIGHGKITAECRRSDGCSIASDLFASYPCRLHLTSRPNHAIIPASATTETATATATATAATKCYSKALTCYVLGYGGGLISGDIITLDISVKPTAALLLTSQSTSKAFKAIPGRDATLVKTNASVGRGGLLFLVPQPMQCFGRSRLEQETHVLLDGGDYYGNNNGDDYSDDNGADDDPSLLLVDWYTGGRKNLDGGLWNMESFHTVTTVSYSKTNLFPTAKDDDNDDDDDVNESNVDANTNTNTNATSDGTNNETKLVFRDATRLSGGKELLRHMRHFNIVCTIVIMGPRLKDISQLFLNQYSSRYIYEDEEEDQTVASLSATTTKTGTGTSTSSSSSNTHYENRTRNGTGGLNQNKGEGLNNVNEGLLISCGTFNALPGSKQSEGGVVLRLAADSLEIAGVNMS